jgi:hypothetical protein
MFRIFQNDKSPPNPSISSNQTSCQHMMDEELSEQLLVSMKPSEIDMKNDVSRAPVGVLVFSFQLAITPPL